MLVAKGGALQEFVLIHAVSEGIVLVAKGGALQEFLLIDAVSGGNSASGQGRGPPGVSIGRCSEWRK